MDSSSFHLAALWQPSLHARLLYEQYSQPPGDSVYRYLSSAKPDSLSAYLALQEQTMRSQSSALGYVIYDTSYKNTSGGSRIAGSISYIKANDIHLSVEIGFVKILPEFRVGVGTPSIRAVARS